MTPRATCAEVRNKTAARPLTCGNVPLRSYCAPKPAQHAFDNDSQNTKPQVKRTFRNGKPHNYAPAQNPPARPLTCGNTQVRNTPKNQNPCNTTQSKCATGCPYGACAHTRAHTHTPARRPARKNTTTTKGTIMPNQCTQCETLTTQLNNARNLAATLEEECANHHQPARTFRFFAGALDEKCGPTNGPQRGAQWAGEEPSF